MTFKMLSQCYFLATGRCKKVISLCLKAQFSKAMPVIQREEKILDDFIFVFREDTINDRNDTLEKKSELIL